MSTSSENTPVIAVSSAFLYRHPLAKNLRMIKEAGFENIELFLTNNITSLSYNDISRDIEEFDLRVPSLHLPIPFGYNENWPDLERSMIKGLKWAERLEAEWVISHPLVVMADADSELEAAVRKRYLGILSSVREKTGSEKLLVENMPNLGTGRPIRNLFSYPEDFLEVLEQSGFGMVFDTTHWGSFDTDVVAGYNFFKRLVANIHLSDHHQGTEHIVPGDGELDLDVFLKELSDSGYSGQLTLELDFTTRGRNAGRKEEGIIGDLIRTREWMEAAF